MPRMTLDRMIALSGLNAYPGSPYLDVTLFLPWTEVVTRRVWLMAPESSPTISIDDATLSPSVEHGGSPRWLDYGVRELPIRRNDWYGGHFHQLRITGMQVAECGSSYLVITPQADLQLEGRTVEQAERELWGLARCDAGSSTLRPSTVSAGESAQFVARFAAGPKGLPAGALVRFCAARAFAKPQANDPQATGFVSVTNADAGVALTEVGETWAAGAFITCRLVDGLAAGQGFDLNHHTDRTHIFTVRRGSERIFPYTDLAHLSAEVALSGELPFVPLAQPNAHAFQVLPGPSERLHLFLPGRRYSSEALRLHGTYTDHHRNSPPAGPIDTAIELWLESDGGGIPLGSPAEKFVDRHRFQIGLPPLSPGVYRAVARRAHTGDEVARSNPLEIVDAGSSQGRLYWGEIHAHTEMSDGSGEYSQLYRHARDEGCLEFAAATDHAEFFSDNQWEWMQDTTNRRNQPGEFVTLVGYETEGKQRDRCVYTSRSRLKLFRGFYPPTSTLNVVWNHFHSDEQVVGGVHALLAHGIVRENWTMHDPSVERFLEIYSMWGANDRHESRLIPDWLRDWLARGLIKQGMSANELLQTGAVLGFTGGGDCHYGRCGFSAEDPAGDGLVPGSIGAGGGYRCGMTAAIMPSLDREPLIGALRNRSTYATTGARILLEFTAASLPMGSIGSAPEVHCQATIHAVGPIRLIEIVKDGDIVFADCFSERSAMGSDVWDTTVSWLDPDRAGRQHYYYLHVEQIDGQQAWSSPIWITTSPEGER